MRLVFQRPLWLEVTAFAAAMTGFIGHILGIWRLSISIGLTLKIDALLLLVKGLQLLIDDRSWLITNLKGTIRVFYAFLTLPAWFQSWYVWSGVLELIVSTALFLVGIFFWCKRTYAVKFFYYVIAASIAIHLLNITSSLIVSESLGIMKMVLDVPFMILKALLIPLVYFSDKSVLGTHAKESVHFEEMVV